MADKLIMVKLLRDYWPEKIPEMHLVDENGRVFAPAKITVSLEEAKRLIAAGIAERADPFPGE